MISRSWASSGPGLSRIESGMPILPTSWSIAARQISSSLHRRTPAEPGEQGGEASHAPDVRACLLAANRERR